MDLLTIGGILLRRWRIVLPVLLMTAVIAFLAALSVKPEYSANGSMLLVNPDGADGQRGQPARAPGDQGVIPASVVAEILQSNDVRARLGAAGARAPYTVAADPEGRILRISVSSAEKGDVMPTMRAVLDLVTAGASRLPGLDQLSDEVTGVVLSGSPTPELKPPPTRRGPAQWTADGSVLLVHRPKANPYTSLAYTVRVLEEAVKEKRLVREVVAGSSATFRVSRQPRDPAPILFVRVSASTRDDVMSTYPRVGAALDRKLDDLQGAAGASRTSRVRLEPLSNPADAAKSSKKLWRPIAGILALGVLAAMSLAILWERLRGPRLSLLEPEDHEPLISEEFWLMSEIELPEIERGPFGPKGPHAISPPPPADGGAEEPSGPASEAASPE